MTAWTTSAEHSDSSQTATAGSADYDALAKYWHESFFSGDSLYHPELDGGRHGVAGDPVPYTIYGDSLLTTVMLACFLMAVWAVAVTRQLIVRQAKNFFFVRSEGTTESTETATETRLQVFLSLLTSLLVALLFYFHTVHWVSDTFTVGTGYLMIAIFLALAVAVYVLRIILYTVVNLTFFDARRNREWLKTLVFITSAEGFALLLPVLMLAYFNVQPAEVVIGVLIIVAIVKLLTFYKSYMIFFRTNSLKIQNILYFCTLEIVPLILLWGIKGMLTDALTVNF